MSGSRSNEYSPLSASSLTTYIAASLPKDAEPQLRTTTDAIAIACHAGMLALSFRLLGLGEEHRLANAGSEPVQPLPKEWNASGSSTSFRYAHRQSSMQYLLKINRLGPKTVIMGIGLGDDKATSFDISTKDYTSESSLPASPCREEVVNPADTAHAIQNIFISPSRLTDLAKELRLNIIQKLVPSLQKEGYEETATDSTQDSQRSPAPNARDPSSDIPTHDPLRADPVLPRPAVPQNPLLDPSFGPRPRGPIPDFPPPGFEDEYEMQRPPRGIGMPGGQPGGPLSDYGQSDLYPSGLGPRDPLRIGPERGGGMAASLQRPNRNFDLQRPDGARWDPVHGNDDDPLGGPGMGMGPRGGRPGFGGPGGGFGGGNPFGGFGSGDFI